MFAGERFDGRGRIHVRDGHQLEIAQRGKLFPARFDLADVRHIGHGAAGVQVGKNHGLMRAAKNVRALGHEMDPAKNDVPGVSLGRLIGELERVAAKIGELYDFIALVVVAENDHIFVQAGSGRGDALIQRIVGNQQIGIEVTSDAGLDFRRANGIGRLSADKGRGRNRDKGAHHLF